MLSMLKYIIPSNVAWWSLPFTGFGIGWYLDTTETERMVMFRDKSALYGRDLGPDEQPTWPRYF